MNGILNNPEGGLTKKKRGLLGSTPVGVLDKSLNIIPPIASVAIHVETLRVFR